MKFFKGLIFSREWYDPIFLLRISSTFREGCLEGGKCECWQSTEGFRNRVDSDLEWIPKDNRFSDWMHMPGLHIVGRFLLLGYMETVVLFTKMGIQETQGVKNIIS